MLYSFIECQQFDTSFNTSFLMLVVNIKTCSGVFRTRAYLPACTTCIVFAAMFVEAECVWSFRLESPSKSHGRDELPRHHHHHHCLLVDLLTQRIAATNVDKEVIMHMTVVTDSAGKCFAFRLLLLPELYLFST